MRVSKIHTMQELKDLQSLPLDFKVEMTKDRIREFYEFNSGKVYVAFSGGKDSTVLLHLVRSIYPEVRAVYANTGMDYPSIVKFVRTFENVDFVQPRKRFASVIREDGLVFPSKDGAQIIKDARRGCKYALMAVEGKDVNGKEDGYKERFKNLKKYVDIEVPISDVCCDYLKELPMKDYERKTGLRPIVAIMASESARRASSWLRTGCNVLGKNARSKPMSFWTEQDVLKYLVQNRIAIADVYGDIVSDDLFDPEYRTTREKRTGCMFCAVPLAHGENRLVYVKKKYPKLYDTFINKMGLGEMFRKLGIKYE